jgi:hypothetical protein
MRPLTRVELEKCEHGPRFENVTPAMIFGPLSDGGLAQRVAAGNIKRYRDLKAEWEYESGARPRPDSFYNA